jgi:hypothetical protein
MRARKAEAMSELDRLVISCLPSGFAGSALPEWTSQAWDEGLAGICPYGATRVRTEAAAEALRA